MVASLSYLKHFPLNQIKIDQSFARDVMTDPEDAAIIDAIISIAHSLNMEVIAEGVETEEQLDFLRARNCHAIQGYYIGHPLPVIEMSRFLESFTP